MNIQFVLKDFAKSGGVERIQYNLAKKFMESGHSVSFYILNGDSVDLDETLEFKTYKGNKTGILSAFREVFKLRKNLKTNGIDVLISAKEQANLISYFSTFFLKCTTIYTRHSALNVSEQKISQRVIFLIYNLLTIGKGKVVTVSHALKDDLSRGLFWGKDRIFVCPNPVLTVTVFEKSIIPIPSLKLPDEYICSVGRLTKTKGFDLLIKAYKRCLNNDPNFPELVIAGDGEEHESLTGLVKELLLTDKVHLIGYVNNPYYIMKNSSGFVLSSRNEGLPTVLIEAIALGVNVVSTDCPTGPKEILSNGKIGMLVPPENIDSLSLAMSKLTSDKLKETDILAMDRYSLEQSADAYTTIF